MSAKASIEFEPRRNLGPAQAEDGAADHGVLAPRQLLIKARAKREDGRNAAARDRDFAMGRIGDAADQLQQRRLAGTIAADDAAALALADLEADVAQDPMLLIEPLPAAEQDLLQLVVSVPIKLKRFAEAVAADHHFR